MSPCHVRSNYIEMFPIGIRIVKRTNQKVGVFCYLDGLRGAILAGGHPLEEAVGRPQKF